MMSLRAIYFTIALALGGILLAVGIGSADDPAQKPSMKDELAALQAPPAWFATTNLTFDTNNPWKVARQEVRRLIARATPAERRQAVKLTYLYVQKGDPGAKAELPIYLFLTGEHAWALQEYQRGLTTNANSGLCRQLAALYIYYGEYDLAERTLGVAMANLPGPPNRIFMEANVYDSYGNLYAAKGDRVKAKQAYEKAIVLIPTSPQTFGRDQFPQRIAIIQSKIALLEHTGLPTTIADGVYTASSRGYIGPLTAAVTVQGHKVTDIKITHTDNAEQQATQLIPQRIIEKQSLKVDGVTGATVTSDAVKDATYRALNRAGLP